MSRADPAVVASAVLARAAAIEAEILAGDLPVDEQVRALCLRLARSERRATELAAELDEVMMERGRG